MGSHSFEEHTGEVRIHLEGQTQEELFEEAARGLAEVMLGPELPGATGPLQEVTLTSVDSEALLVDWLNELVFRADAEHRIITEAHVDAATDTELRARIRGAEVEVLKTAVKAATLHGLHLQRSPGRITASVVLDV